MVTLQCNEFSVENITEICLMAMSVPVRFEMQTKYSKIIIIINTYFKLFFFSLQTHKQIVIQPIPYYNET